MSAKYSVAQSNYRYAIQVIDQQQKTIGCLKHQTDELSSTYNNQSKIDKILKRHYQYMLDKTKNYEEQICSGIQLFQELIKRQNSVNDAQLQTIHEQEQSI